MFGAPLVIIKSASGQNSQPLAEFDKIVLKDNVKVEMVIADRYSIYVEGGLPAESADMIRNQTLVLTNEKLAGRKAKVFVKSVSSIECDDLASIESVDTLKGSSVSVKLQGKSKATILLNVSNLLINADDMSSLTMAGSATRASMRADGAASIKSEELVCQDLTVETDGAANAKVQSLMVLNAKVDGASTVRFKGDPQKRNFSILGLGTIKGSKEGEEYDGAVDSMKDRVTKELTNDGDTTRVKIGKRKLMIIEDKNKEKAYGEKDKDEKTRGMKTVWGGFELGVQGFATPSLSFTMPSTHSFLSSDIGNSWFFALNAGDFDGHIIKNKLALTTGLGILWSNIHFDGNDYLTPNSGTLTATSPAAGTKLSLNKLYTFDITAPLLIKFAPGRNNKAKGGFHIAAGAIIHYVATSRVVTETSSAGYNQRIEMNDDFNINPFRVDGTVRMGYDRVKLFANYSLTPYFNSAKAPDVRLFSAGLTLIGF